MNRARFYEGIINISVIQGNAPTNDTEADVKEEFYNTLQRVPNRDLVILMGDYSTKVGRNNIGREEIMGKNGEGKISSDGEHFGDVCGFNFPVTGDTIFPHKVTWAYSDSVTENQIDHISISK